MSAKNHVDKANNDFIDVQNSLIGQRSSITQRFPRELIELIVDDMADDREALKALALVSNAFTGRAQTHLHRSVSITSPETAAKASQVYGSSKLGSFVRELSVNLSAAFTDADHATDVFEAIIPHMQHVKHIDLIGSTPGGFIPELMDVLEAHMHDIQSLKVAHSGQTLPPDIRRLARCFPKLLTLDLHYSNPQTTMIISPHPEEGLRYLKNLRVFASNYFHNETGFLHRLMINLGQPQLETVALRLADLSAANALVAHCGPRLKHLMLSHPIAKSGALRGLRLDHNSSLQSIEYSWHNSRGADEQFSQLPGVLATLKIPSLRELRINYCTHTPRFRVETMLDILKNIPLRQDIAPFRLILCWHVYLTIHQPDAVQETFSSLQNTLRERVQSVFPLGTVALDCSWSIRERHLGPQPDWGFIQGPR